MLGTAQLLRLLFLILVTIVAHSIQSVRLALSSRAALSAEVLFLASRWLSIKSTRCGRSGEHRSFPVLLSRFEVALRSAFASKPCLIGSFLNPC